VFPDAAVFRVVTMESLVSRSVAARRFQLFVLGLFGLLSLALATIGVGAVLLLAVRQRGREIGIRLALGERPAGIYWRVQRRGLVLVGAGATAGVGLALAGARIFATLVQDVSVRDPVAFIGAPLLLALAALAAGAWPAARAMRLDPLRILRDG
jgi:ABC-type antimicrobial peptide transport system permease subunit